MTALVVVVALLLGFREAAGCLLRVLAVVAAAVVVLVVLALALGWALGHGLVDAAADVDLRLLVDLLASLL
ncbi:MAG: hypothetical protein AAGI91_16550 [Bacteroidota bacterium]